MKLVKLLGLGMGGVGCLLLMGCAGSTTYTTGTDYYVRDHVYVDTYHRHYYPPRYYPVHRHYYPPRHGGFIGGGGHPDHDHVIGSAPAPSSHGGGFSGAKAAPPVARSSAESHTGGFTGGKTGS